MGVLVWIVASGLVGWVAHNKGRSFAVYLILSLLFSPVIGIIIVALLKPDLRTKKERDLERGEMKKCPYCAELVKVEAQLCRYCGREFTHREVGVVVVDEGFKVPPR
jgi:hypothetical protein